MASDLNPEAPEFHPKVPSVTQDGYNTVQKTIRSASYYPKGTAYDLFKTFIDFNMVSCQLSENIVMISNHVINTEQPISEFKGNDLEYIIDKIIDSNDSLLDRVNLNIDTLKGVNKPSEKFLDGIRMRPNVSAWNKPVLAQFQVGKMTLLGAENIARPQLTFKDFVDNSGNLWMPKIVDKPNNIKPLALTLLYDEKGDKLGFEHPYGPELQLYHPPSRFIDPDKPLEPITCNSLENTKFTYIDTEQQLDLLVDHLTKVDEIGVDSEYHSYRSYQGFTCLIQISTIGGDFIIDALAVREHIHKLNLAFTDPKKIKVIHGADNDILWLQKDFGVYIVGLFDTHQAAKLLAFPSLSFKSILKHYCGVDIDKKYQLADWRIRPLPAELIKYARLDTHYLLYIWRKMKEELLSLGGNKPHQLLAVFEKSRLISAKTYNKEVIGENSHMSLYLSYRKNFNTQQMAALKMLYQWRDSQARLLDESTMYLIPNHMLLALAENLPREIQGVNAICNPMPPFVMQNLVSIHRMLLSCREIPVTSQIYQTEMRPINIWNIPPPNYITHDVTQIPGYKQFSNYDIQAMNSALSCANFINSKNREMPSRQGFVFVPEMASTSSQNCSFLGL